MKNFIVGIDGPAGSGKSTIAKIIAQKYDFTYIDTGAMYRMICLYFLENNIELEDKVKVSESLKHIEIDMQDDKFFLQDRDVTKEIRSKEINDNVSKVAAIKAVRDNLVSLQRKISEDKNVILDGRDIGTVVFPNADLKIFLLASPEERAKRRHLEFQQKKIEITYDEVLYSIRARDHIDTNRKESPLVKAKDAIELDTTTMSIEEVLDFISEKIEAKR